MKEKPIRKKGVKMSEWSFVDINATVIFFQKTYCQFVTAKGVMGECVYSDLQMLQIRTF